MENLNDKNGTAVDFAPDLKPVKDTKKATSIKFDDEVRQELARLRASECLNVSALVNSVVADYLANKKALEADKRCCQFGDYVRVDLLLHKEVAEFLQAVELLRGAIPLANKLLEVFAQMKDNGNYYFINQGSCDMQGVNNDTMQIYKGVIKRAKERLRADYE